MFLQEHEVTEDKERNPSCSSWLSRIKLSKVTILGVKFEL